MGSCVLKNIKFLSFLASVIFSGGGLCVSSIKLFLSEDPTQEALYLSLFSSIISLWIPSPVQLMKNKKQYRQATDLPSLSSSTSSDQLT